MSWKPAMRTPPGCRWRAMFATTAASVPGARKIITLPARTAASNVRRRSTVARSAARRQRRRRGTRTGMTEPKLRPYDPALRLEALRLRPVDVVRQVVVGAGGLAGRAVFVFDDVRAVLLDAVLVDVLDVDVSVGGLSGWRGARQQGDIGDERCFAVAFGVDEDVA